MQYFRPYLYMNKFILITDHSALRWLFKQTNPTGRLARWIMIAAEYPFEVVHKKGRLHKNVDALSRIPISQ